MFCQYKDSFMGIAWRDAVTTILSGLILALIFKFNILYSILALFVLGILLHRLCCVRTTADKFLFPEN